MPLIKINILSNGSPLTSKITIHYNAYIYEYRYNKIKINIRFGEIWKRFKNKV